MVEGKIILNVESGNNSIESTFSKEETLNCLNNLGILLKDNYKKMKFRIIST